MSRRMIELLVRFSVVYGLLVWLCYAVPAYEWIERGTSAIVDGTLQLAGGAGEQRSLGFEARQGGYYYIYDVELENEHRTLVRGYHKHAFILVLFVGLALGTPNLRWRRRATAFVVGGVLTFGICVGMLMADLQGWERAAFTDSDGPYPGVIMTMRGLHLTAAGGMLPIIIWAFLVAGPMLDELRSESSQPA